MYIWSILCQSVLSNQDVGNEVYGEYGLKVYFQIMPLEMKCMVNIVSKSVWYPSVHMVDFRQ